MREGSRGRSGSMGGVARELGDRSLDVPCSRHAVVVGGGGGGGSVLGKLACRHDRFHLSSLGSLLALGKVLAPPPRASFACSHSLCHPPLAGLDLQDEKF